eukprot:TRINITY_DN37327_c0_g1_i1.p1 TRINITY_DN37327_c0_g1~~TRINITY_DN37327_c0_g1_i1.p1  ORF type:complete len:516 (-),score=74.03 TRINITY_DN37327_c0_g1_i1:311-1822(-)
MAAEKDKLLTGSADGGLVESSATKNRPVESFLIDTNHADLHHMNRARTGQMLLAGSLLALCGLLLSLFFLGFRTNCDTDHRISVSVQDSTGAWVDCKRSSGTSQGYSNLSATGVSVSVNGKMCTDSSNCSGFVHGFCPGALEHTRGKAYCSEHPCTCAAIFYDCGAEHWSTIELKPSMYLQQCEGENCHKETVLTLPNYPMHRSRLVGCKSLQRLTLEEVRNIMQQHFEALMIYEPLLPTSDAAWDDLKKLVDEVPHVKFASFWPSTISESVSNMMSPEAEIFFAFMLCASMCFIKSEYTTEVETVDLPGYVIPYTPGVHYNTVRAYMPPIGLILLAAVQMVPTARIFSLTHEVMTLVHLAGAQFCFVVYLACEATSLMVSRNREQMAASEYKIRSVLCIVGSCAMVVFGLAYMTLVLFTNEPGKTSSINNPYSLGGMGDMYEKQLENEETVLIRPAQGSVLTIKFISYVAEYLVALSLVLSHLVIWFFFNRRLAKETVLVSG